MNYKFISMSATNYEVMKHIALTNMVHFEQLTYYMGI